MSDFYNKYPYTDFHELNLDWVLEKIKSLENIVNNLDPKETNNFCLFVEDIDVNTDNPGSINSSRLNSYLHDHRDQPILVKFGSGTYQFDDTITIYPKHCFIGYNSATSSTVLDFSNSSRVAAAFKISDEAVDDAYAYSYRYNSFMNMRIKGNVNRHGIEYGIPATDHLINVPNLLFENIEVYNFKYGIICEGYAHSFTNVHVNGCNKGIYLLHPEQVIMINTWLNHNIIGLCTNNDDYKTSGKYDYYGHTLKVLGGSIQRNTIGCKLWNVQECAIETYFELNTQEDVLVGDPDDRSSYTKGAKNLEITSKYTAGGRTSGYYSVRCYGTVGAKICNYTTENNSDYLYVDGYCKYFDVYMTPERTQNLSYSGDIAKSIRFFNGFVEDFGTDQNIRTTRKGPGWDEFLGYDTKNSVGYKLTNGQFLIDSSDNTSRFRINMNGALYDIGQAYASFDKSLYTKNGNGLRCYNSDNTNYGSIYWNGDYFIVYDGSTHRMPTMTSGAQLLLPNTSDESLEPARLSFDGTHLKIYMNGSWYNIV